MKIRSISCTQFAGIRDRDISFGDGINVVFGRNESGKSTLVNLLSRTLFQNSHIDRRSDREFQDLFFPGERRGSSIVSDFADGKVTLETENGTFSLSKEWGAESRCLLSTPDGVIKDQKAIDAFLKELLVYGEGVYSDMLFSSQKNTDASLRTILDAAKRTEAKQEIADAVSQAFAESGGISIDVIGQAIAARIKELAGEHWECGSGTPERKRGGGRWAKGLGEVHKAYYAWEDARETLAEISGLEDAAEQAAKRLTESDQELCSAEELCNKFSGFAEKLALCNERRRIIANLEKELKKYHEVLKDWPELTASLEKARRLRREKSDRELLERREAARRLMEEISSVDCADVPCPTDGEIMQVRKSQRSITAYENKLCGMNLHAAVKLFGENSVEVTSLRTGERLDISAGSAAITEAVRITVPGVMEMELSPADVNVEEITGKTEELRRQVGEIFARYGVSTLEELEQLSTKIGSARARADVLKNQLSTLLGGSAYEELEKAAGEMNGEVCSLAEITACISDLCGNVDIDRFIAAREALSGRYEEEYGSVSELKAKAFDVTGDLEKAVSSVENTEDIPEEFRSISDPEAHLEDLKKKLRSCKEQREQALTERTSAESRLEGMRSALTDDPAERAEMAEAAFSEKKALLGHWLHISEVFEAQKESLDSEPMHDIAESFARYLSVISGGRVSSEFPQGDKLNINIYSSDRLMNYGRLSEGTKETISLAFRLAVLDHLFPDGGGVIVLDDPFTDMDAERTAQSCELLKACAGRHQVIFLTCREEYIDMLKGNTIRV